MPVDVCFVVGARPNFMKAAPVFFALRELDPSLELLLVHTGQHYDASMSDVFFDELGLPRPDVTLACGSGSHAEQTARALVGIEDTLVRHDPRVVVVTGDVNSTLAAALAAVKLEIPVAHVESGLRCFDDAMPEEHNRRLTDHCSALLFAHSADAVDNLTAEGIDPQRIHLVGNTMIDSLVAHLDRARLRQPWLELGCRPRDYGLVTLHRPSLVDDPVRLGEAVAALCSLGRRMPLVFPVHPRTLERLVAASLVTQLQSAGVVLAPPLGYLDFLALQTEARFVVTDSGGIQEETSYLRIPCFTLRARTERPITVTRGTNIVLGDDPAALADIPRLLDMAAPEPIPLWDGDAGTRAGHVLAEFLRTRSGDARPPLAARR